MENYNGKVVEFINHFTNEVVLKVYFIGPEPDMWYTRYLINKNSK